MPPSPSAAFDVAKIANFSVAGVRVSQLNMDIACGEIARRIEEGAGSYFIFRDVNGIVSANDDDKLLEAHEAAGFVAPDGMPLVWLARAMGFRRVERVYGPDFLLEICRRYERAGYRHYFFGSTPEVTGKLVAELTRRFPGLEIVGHYSPPFRSVASQPEPDDLERIRAADPDIVWVGLGTPKQERWMHTHSPHLPGAMLMGVGAAFDFHSKSKRQAPRWMQTTGLEWSFRLMTEPRRLWRRYLVGIPRFLLLLLIRGCGPAGRRHETPGNGA
jgi:N-acetylglucosaminyldiphosphoundecaprenol N-acetyl-beta-D-mannosaminyltransferase